jgi:hypothetical protein
MKRLLVPLANVLAVLAALAFGFVCFLGKYYSTLGDFTSSVIWAVLIALLLIVFAMGAKLLKILVVFAALTMFFAYQPFSHCFAVWEEKEKIQRELNINIAKAERIFPEYEKYAAKRKKANLLPANYPSMKRDYSIWLANVRYTVNVWDPVGIVDATKEIEQVSNIWLASFKKLSNDFDHKFAFYYVKKYFIAPGEPPLLSIFLAALLYAFMLLPYVFKRRNSNLRRKIPPRDTDIP